jgi:hypothetical protein
MTQHDTGTLVHLEGMICAFYTTSCVSVTCCLKLWETLECRLLYFVTTIA